MSVQLSAERRTYLALAAFAVLAASALPLSSYVTYLFSVAMIWIIAAVGLNLLVGNTGQISLCHTSFMAIGAYTSTLLTTHTGLPFWVGIPAGVLLAAIVGAALGAPATRLTGLYLALATLGFLQIVQITIEEAESITGGVRGLNVPKASLGGAPLGHYGLYLVVLGCCIASVWLAANLLASRIGREFNAVRQSPHATQALGISAARVKLVAFSVSAAYAGLAGGLLAVLVGFVEPVEFGVAGAVRVVTFIVVGGMGSLAGSVLGAGILSFLPEILRPVKEYGDLIYTSILLAFLIFLPRGLVVLWRGMRGFPIWRGRQA
ncbi:MAG: branched-chain amino acid ABC transporter permease [Pseudomonadota bacterium]